MTTFSPQLRMEVACFVARLLAGSLDDPLSLASALENLAETIWIEIRESLPPSAQLE